MEPMRGRSTTTKAVLPQLLAPFFLVTTLQAQPNSISLSYSSAIEIRSTGSSEKLRFGGLVATPDGYYEMCASNLSLCRLHNGRIAKMADGSIKLTGALMGQLSSINAAVNSAIAPVHRAGWMPGRTTGDCKDFALTKRQRLIASGWPSSAVPVAIVRTAAGEQHLVLVARTDQGDFVLDNLTQSVVPWTHAPYTWEKIQSTIDLWAWRSLG
jgi:predicted transglutaminase-like cysteine proteinase